MKLNLNLKKTFLPLFLGLTIASTSVAQFSGNIEFKKTVGKIVVTYKYFVSGDNVRLEEINENGKGNIQLSTLIRIFEQGLNKRIGLTFL